MEFLLITLVLGKHSGRHAFKTRLEELGFTVTEEEMNELFVTFKDLADRKKEMTDDDLVALVLEEKISKDDQFYQLQFYSNSIWNESSSNSNSYSYRSENEEIQEAGTGSREHRSSL